MLISYYSFLQPKPSLYLSNFFFRKISLFEIYSNLFLFSQFKATFLFSNEKSKTPCNIFFSFLKKIIRIFFKQKTLTFFGFHVSTDIGRTALAPTSTFLDGCRAPPQRRKQCGPLPIGSGTHCLPRLWRAGSSWLLALWSKWFGPKARAVGPPSGATSGRSTTCLTGPLRSGLMIVFIFPQLEYIVISFVRRNTRFFFNRSTY